MRAAHRPSTAGIGWLIWAWVGLWAPAAVVAQQAAPPAPAPPAPAPAGAAPTAAPQGGATPSTADVLSDQAKALFRENKYAEALAAFDRAHAAEARASFLYNMAKCKEKLGDYNGAVALLENYLTLYRSQNGGADPANAADTARLIVDLKRRAVDTLPEVALDSSPRGAQVLENGVVLGNTPMTLRLTPGVHKLLLKLDRHLDHDAEVQVPQSGKSSVTLALKPISEVTIDSTPRGAQVLENGVILGNTPLTTQLTPGPHKLVLKLDRHIDLDAVVQVPPTGKVAVLLSMKTNVHRAAVAFSCNVRGAQVILDGKIIAMTPIVGQIEVVPGPHQVILSREGYGVFEGNIQVPDDSVATVSVQLKRLEKASSWRAGLGWPLLILGSIAAGGGGVASYFADQEWRGTDRFNTLQKLQNYGYWGGGGAAALGLLLVAWEGLRNPIPDDERVDGAQLPPGITLQPLGAGKP